MSGDQGQGMGKEGMRDSATMTEADDCKIATDHLEVRKNLEGA